MKTKQFGKSVEDYFKESKDYLSLLGLDEQLSSSSFKSLEQTIANTLYLNSRLPPLEVYGIEYVKTPQDMIEVMTVRSKSFGQVGNSLEFSDPVLGLNYDMFDNGKSIILTHKEGNEIVATSRLILDSKVGLFSEQHYDTQQGYDAYRTESNMRGKKIAELSRTAILEEYQKGPSFRNLMAGIYVTARNLNISHIATAVREKEAKTCEKFGMKRIKQLQYGIIPNCSILMWDLNSQVSSTFKKVILQEK